MLILLPPSETKLGGGTGPPLDLGALSWPELTATRQLVLAAVLAVSADVVQARRALGLGSTQDSEIAQNLSLFSSPTRPALRRYNGVLYDALDYHSLPPAARRRADDSLVVGSALFGFLRATDPIPAYRLSAGSRLPALRSLGGLWRAVLPGVLASRDDVVIDLRSGAYAALAPVPGALVLRVVSIRPDGSRAAVSHHNKATKGRLARLLVSSRAALTDHAAVRRALRTAGLTCQRSGPQRLDVLSTL